jgi:hypothetical protein
MEKRIPKQIIIAYRNSTVFLSIPISSGNMVFHKVIKGINICAQFIEGYPGSNIGKAIVQKDGSRPRNTHPGYTKINKDLYFMNDTIEISI